MTPLAERVERISDAYEYSTDRENGDAVARAELRAVAEEMRVSRRNGSLCGCDNA